MDEERKLQTVEGSENKAVIPLCCVDLYIARTYYRSVQRGVLICLARPPPPLMQIIRRLPAAEPGCRT